MKTIIFLLLMSCAVFAAQSGSVDLGPTIGSGGGGGVTSLNSLTGALDLVGGTGITVTPSGSNITITSTGGGSGTVTEVDTGSGLTGGPITTSGTISCDVASSSVSGCLSSTDWTTFNNKANTALSNLTSPTSLNQDLIFNEGTNAQILTANSSTGPTANLNMKTGDGTGQASGSFSIGAGNSDTQSGGNVEFSGGNVTSATSNQSSGGQVSMFAGNTASTNINAEGGSIFIAAGNAPIAGNSGGVSIYDGNGLGGINIGPNLGVNILDNAGIQGLLIFNTDRELDDAGGNPILTFTSDISLMTANTSSSPSPQINISTGTSSSGNTGTIMAVSGNAGTGGMSGGFQLGTGGGDSTGDVNFSTGDANAASGNSGNIQFQVGKTTNGTGGNITFSTGQATGTGSAGNIVLQLGSASGGTPGTIQWQDGSQGTSGQCLVSTDTNGSGSWAACPGGGSGANTSLSNLSSVAINSDLLFNAGGTFTVGSSGAPASNMYSNNYILYDNFGDEDGLIYEASPNGFGVEAMFPGITGSFPAGNLVLSTNVSSTAITGDVDIITGVGTGFGSGNVNINTATESGQQSGGINIGTGNSSGNATGLINITTGNATATGGASSPIEITAGSVVDPAQQAGSITLQGGQNTGAASLSGGVSLSDGNADTQILINTNGILANDNAGNSVLQIPNLQNTPGTATFESQLYFSVSPTGSGSQPTLSSCGTSPTLSSAGNDATGSITIGSGVVTSCTLTFENTWSSTPHCFVNVQGSTAIVSSAVPSTTQVVFSFSVTAASDVIDYFCVGES